MSNEAIAGLLRSSAFAFLGTAQESDTEDGVEVHVDQVLHAPEPFQELAGSTVTLRPAEGEDPPAPGDAQVFFANGISFGDRIDLQEVGRLAGDAVQDHLATAASEPGSAPPLTAVAHAIAEHDRLGHAADADAVVAGRVTGLRKVTGPPPREHDPDWWIATIEVTRVDKGDVGADVDVLYANSLDVRWRQVPKPKASQNGVFLLHRTDGPLSDLAPYQLQHPEDLQAPQAIDLPLPEVP
jgi:hypothetical protein